MKIGDWITSIIYWSEEMINKLLLIGGKWISRNGSFTSADGNEYDPVDERC